MDNPAAGVILIAVALAAWWWLRRGTGAGRDAETQLRRICLGDDKQMERLLDNEMSRARGISRAEAARRAVARYQRDNR